MIDPYVWEMQHSLAIPSISGAEEVIKPRDIFIVLKHIHFLVAAVVQILGTLINAMCV